MIFLKRFLVVLFLPLTTYGQTIHIEEDRIVYKGEVNVDRAAGTDLYESAMVAVRNHVKGKKDVIIAHDKDKGTMTAQGVIKLTTPYELKRRVGYILELTVTGSGYTYRIDSVYMKQVERGGKTIKLNSTELFKGVEATGPESVEAEKQLNEIDMRFQKLLALLRNEIKSNSVAKSP